MAAFLSEEAKAALTASITSVEARSCAELVIVVRAQSGSYLHSDLIAAIVAGLATLAALLYLPVDFGLHSFLIDPLVVGLLVGLLSWRLPPLRRLSARLSSGADARRARVREAAEAAFFRKGIRRTREAIGIMIYVSLLERRAEVVADHGVVAAVPEDRWRAAVAEIDARVRAGEDGVRVAGAIEALGEVLEPCLPRSEDDVNELPDEVCE